MSLREKESGKIERKGKRDVLVRVKMKEKCFKNPTYRDAAAAQVLTRRGR